MRLPAILDLACHRCAVALVEQRPREAAQEEARHEILEHGATPGEQGHRTGRAGERPAELKPMSLGHIPARNGQETGKPGLRRQQIVVGIVQPAQGKVVANGKQMTPLVVKDFEIHSAS